MKVMKVKSRNYKDKSYYKYRVNIPEKELKKANIKEGDEIYAESGKDEIILRKSKQKDERK